MNRSQRLNSATASVVSGMSTPSTGSSQRKTRTSASSSSNVRRTASNNKGEREPQSAPSLRSTRNKDPASSSSRYSAAKTLSNTDAILTTAFQKSVDTTLPPPVQVATQPVPRDSWDDAMMDDLDLPMIQSVEDHYNVGDTSSQKENEGLWEDSSAPELEDNSAPELQDNSAPDLEDNSAPDLEDTSAPEDLLDNSSAPELLDYDCSEQQNHKPKMADASHRQLQCFVGQQSILLVDDCARGNPTAVPAATTNARSFLKNDTSQRIHDTMNRSCPSFGDYSRSERRNSSGAQDDDDECLAPWDALDIDTDPIAGSDRLDEFMSKKDDKSSRKQRLSSGRSQGGKSVRSTRTSSTSASSNSRSRSLAARQEQRINASFSATSTSNMHRSKSFSGEEMPQQPRRHRREQSLRSTRSIKSLNQSARNITTGSEEPSAAMTECPKSAPTLAKPSRRSTVKRASHNKDAERRSLISMLSASTVGKKQQPKEQQRPRSKSQSRGSGDGHDKVLLAALAAKTKFQAADQEAEARISHQNQRATTTTATSSNHLADAVSEAAHVLGVEHKNLPILTAGAESWEKRAAGRSLIGHENNIVDLPTLVPMN